MIDGGATVTGLQVFDGHTIRFLVNVPDIEASYRFSLADGAVVDLQGQSSAAFEGSFLIDRTGPRVATQTPALQASAPFELLTFTFDEEINASSFTVADIASFVGPGGVNLRSQVTSVTGNGRTFTVHFSPQSAQGTYTMVIGPNITDLVGNLMDQVRDGLAGQSNDTYTATVDLQSPDLRVDTVVFPDSRTTANFGETIDVRWRVTNVGSDPALEGHRDRVYLSANTTFDSNDLLLATVPTQLGDVPLFPGAHYERTQSVTLPLNLTVVPGTYFILVRTDALGEQPESNEGNNTQVGEALVVTLPPLPDLVVSEIVAPVKALSDQNVDVTWTLRNQGSGDVTGAWRDYVFLSADSTIGNDQFFGAFDFEGTIPAGETITRVQTIHLPRDMQGQRWFVVQTDVHNSVFEHGNENNNTSIDDRPMDVELSPFPNLQVSAIDPPETAFSSQQTIVEWTVSNVGTGTASAPFWNDAVWLSLDSLLDETDVFLGSTGNASYLDAGDSYVNSLTVTLPRGIDGNYRFLVMTDWHNHVFELDGEQDNLRAASVTRVELTPPPDLRVSVVERRPAHSPDSRWTCSGR